MLQGQLSTTHRAKHNLSVTFASSEQEVRDAQRLRWQVFAGEMGANLPSREAGIDSDIFDKFCEHLIVRDNDTLEIVGTYRILTPGQAKKIGGYYSETEFDLTRLANYMPRMVEVGRSCVHPAYRTGATISLLWAGLAKFTMTHGYDYLVGCASVSMADGGHVAASIYNKLRVDSMSPVEWRVFPRHPLPLAALDNKINAPLPPLIKGYMRLGAYVCGDPAWDPDFNTADLLVMLPMSLVSQRYARHFLERV